MPVVMKEIDVVRYFVYGKFNPASPKQILDYIKKKNLRPGYNHKTESESTDSETLKRLAKVDPLFKFILEWREVNKVDTTYASPYLARLDSEARIHATYTHNPSTLRLSCVRPNLTNVPDDEDEESYARRFRKTVEAAPGCLFVEADFSAIEAVLTGWYMGDENYMRLATMGIHSLVLAQILGKPADLRWPDNRLREYLANIKATYKNSAKYHGCKRGVHLTNYGGSPMMMVRAEPDIFQNVRDAADVQQTYFKLCPKLAPWQKDVRDRAAKEHCLGGNDHPFKYKHWFWDVVAPDNFGNFKPGSDWNKVVAYYPQSTAAGVLYEACLRLTDPDSEFFVGDMYYGMSPLRALIHDSILAEVPVEKLKAYLDRLIPCMSAPVPQLSGLRIGVDVKIGQTWGDMKPMKEYKELLK